MGQQAVGFLGLSDIRFFEAIDNSPLAISLSTLDEERFLDANRSFLQLVGYSRDELIGRTSWELNLQVDSGGRRGMIEVLRQRRSLQDLEIRYRRKTGEIRFGLSSVEVVEIDGRSCLLTLSQDITRRKQIEDELVKLSRALEQTADNVMITRHDGVIEYANPAFEKSTGYTREEIYGKTPRILKSGNHDLQFYQRLWSTILAGETFRAEFINRKKDGELYYEEKTITPLKDAQGELTHFISTGKDITDRARAFRTLERLVGERTQETAHLYERAEQRRREIEVLYKADEQLYRHLRLDQVLQTLVDVVIDILHADKASVQVWDEQRERLVVRAARGYSPGMIARMSNYAPGDGISGMVFLTGATIAVDDAGSANPPADLIAEKEGIRSVLSVPITINGHVFGVFGMDYCTPRSFNDDDKRLFQALAQRAAMAIENARLYEQVEQAAIMEERQRLARELHDSVTQSLYSLILLAEAGRRFASAGDLAQAEHHLRRLGETGQQALKEMRLMVYEMRPLALQQEGLVGALKQRLDAVEKRAGIQTRLLLPEKLNLPPSLDEELYRIVQEALNNSLKHAAASQVSVGVSQTGEWLDLEVVDDGKGFDLESIADMGGMGISSMHERAARLGGRLEIDSTPGQGARIKVRVRTNGENRSES